MLLQCVVGGRLDWRTGVCWELGRTLCEQRMRHPERRVGAWGGRGNFVAAWRKFGLQQGYGLLSERACKAAFRWCRTVVELRRNVIGRSWDDRPGGLSDSAG